MGTGIALCKRTWILAAVAVKRDNGRYINSGIMPVQLLG